MMKEIFWCDVCRQMYMKAINESKKNEFVWGGKLNLPLPAQNQKCPSYVADLTRIRELCRNSGNYKKINNFRFSHISFPKVPDVKWKKWVVAVAITITILGLLFYLLIA